MVELIVVIAIIGVLAAILVPTMIGMTVKARITSLNSTAASIQKSINQLLLQADSAHFGIIQSKTIIFDITIDTSGGNTTWNCSAATAGAYNNNNAGGYIWGTAGSYTAGDDMRGVTSGESIICQSLCDKFPEIKHGAMVLVLTSGNCSFVAFTKDSTTALPTSEYPPITDGQPAGKFVWDGKNAGVSPSGMLIGTSPAVIIG